MKCVGSGILGHVGMTVFNLWLTGPHSVKPALVDPSWYGWGGDIAITAPALPCVRLGIREEVVFQVQDETEGFVGHRTHTLTQLALGTEFALRWRFQMGAYLQPGVRATRIHDTVDLPAVSTEYHDVTVFPSLTAGMVVRWWAVPRLGVHLDLQAPLVDFQRALNFAGQFVGAGVDLRIDHSASPR